MLIFGTHHRHCIISGKTIDEDETFCDELCKVQVQVGPEAPDAVLRHIHSVAGPDNP
jgi:hypothetical protein